MAAIVIATSLYLYAGAVLLTIIMAFVLKMFYSQRSKAKFKEYQSEIARSHSKILKLEVKNEKLQQHIDQLEAMTLLSKIA